MESYCSCSTETHRKTVVLIHFTGKGRRRLHPLSRLLVQGRAQLIACTPSGVIEALDARMFH